MLNRPRIAALAATVVTGVLLLSACGGSPEPVSTSAAAPDPDATLTVGLVLEPGNLDIRRSSGAAIEQILVDNIYEGLVTRTPDNEVEPRLASAYEVTPDGLTYRFTLRDGVQFHSGAAMTSADVLASYEQVRTDAALQGHADFAGIATIDAPDPNSIVITLAEPNQNFLFSLTGPAGLVFPVGDTTNLQSAENGTGPFTLSSWKKGSAITFERFDGYWGAPAGVAEVVFEYIPDFTAGVNAALDGSLDVLTAVDPNLAPQLEDSGSFTLTSGRTTDKATLAFNNARAPLDDVRVREALRLAVDHEAIVEAVGAGQTLYGPIPELDPGYEDLAALAPYDPARAKQLLAEAGHPQLDLTLTIPAFYGTTVPKLLVSDFAKVGVTLDVDSVEFPTWLEDVYTHHDYDLSFVLHVEPRDLATFTDPEYYFGYHNPAVDRLYAEAIAETDAKASAKLLAQAARQISQDHAADWLYNAATITAVRPGVSGFPRDSINSRIDLAGVTVAAPGAG